MIVSWLSIQRLFLKTFGKFFFFKDILSCVLVERTEVSRSSLILVTLTVHKVYIGINFTSFIHNVTFFNWLSETLLSFPTKMHFYDHSLFHSVYNTSNSVTSQFFKLFILCLQSDGVYFCSDKTTLLALNSVFHHSWWKYMNLRTCSKVHGYTFTNVYRAFRPFTPDIKDTHLVKLCRSWSLCQTVCLNLVPQTIAA